MCGDLSAWQTQVMPLGHHRYALPPHLSIRRFMDNFWQTCSAQLEQELTPQQFSAWIKPLAPLDYEDGTLRIAAPNRFKLDWVKTQFASRITLLAAEFWEAPIEVQFVLDPRLAAPKKAVAPAQARESGDGNPA